MSENNLSPIILDSINLWRKSINQKLSKQIEFIKIDKNTTKEEENILSRLYFNNQTVFIVLYQSNYMKIYNTYKIDLKCLIFFLLMHEYAHFLLFHTKKNINNLKYEEKICDKFSIEKTKKYFHPKNIDILYYILSKRN